jgi:hypothetical protein
MCFLFFAFGSVFLSVQRETIGSFLRRAVKNDTIHQANADATSDADSERRDMDDNRRALWFLTASGGRPRRRFNGAVVALSLINSNTNQAIVNLTNNQVIALDEIGLSAPAFSIQAWTSNVGIESVVFRHVDGLNNSTLAQRRETEPPWTLCGNVASEFTTCLELGLGQHAVTATPYATKRAARPSKGKAMTVSFWIVQSKAEAAPMSAVPAPTVVHLPLPPPLNAPIAADPATAPAPTSPAISPIVDIVPSAPFASGPAAPVVAAPVNANAPQLAAPALVSGPLPVPPSPVQSPKGSLPASPITVAPKIPPVGSNPMPKASSKSPAVAPVKAPKSESSPVSAAVQCSIPKVRWTPDDYSTQNVHPRSPILMHMLLVYLSARRKQLARQSKVPHSCRRSAGCHDW